MRPAGSQGQGSRLPVLSILIAVLQLRPAERAARCLDKLQGALSTALNSFSVLTGTA